LEVDVDVFAANSKEGQVRVTTAAPRCIRDAHDDDAKSSWVARIGVAARSNMCWADVESLLRGTVPNQIAALNLTELASWSERFHLADECAARRKVD
jgi:hypothetical protein